MMEIVFFCCGVAVGMIIRQEIADKKYNTTYQQIDEKLKRELDYYKELSKSLKEDVKALKFIVYHKEKQ